MWTWMIFIMNFISSNFQILKIISELFLSTPLSQNGMIDLDSGTNTDSEKRLKSSKGSGVEIDSGSGSKSRRWSSSPHSFPHDGMWLSTIGDFSFGMTGIGIKTDSKMLLKLGNVTGVNSDAGIWIGSQIWGSKSHSSLSSIPQKWEPANLSMGLSKVWNWSSSIWWS